jgi:hypothetical protein
LAKWLRLLGYDTICFHTKNDQPFLASAKEGRLLLTRNTRLASAMPRGLLLKENNPRVQLKKVLAFFHIKPDITLFFSRCHLCNEKVIPIEKKAVYGKVPDYVWSRHEDFSICPACEKVYWKGSHVERFKKDLQGLIH